MAALEVLALNTTVPRIEAPQTGDTYTFPRAADIPLGTAALPAVAFTGDLNTGIFSPTADTFAVATGGTERLRVDSAGNAGLGTTTPTSIGATTAALSLNSTAANSSGAVVFQNSGTQIARTGIFSGFLVLQDLSSANGIAIDEQSARPIVFSTTATERMRLDASGNLGIGTTSPVAKLTVNGNQSFSNTTYQIGYALNTETGTVAGANSPFYGLNMATFTGFSGNGIGLHGYYGLLFSTAGTERMRLDSAGNLGLGVTPSAWGSTFRAIQVGGVGSVFSRTAGSGNQMWLAQNAYHDAGGWKYVTTAPAAQIELASNSMSFLLAASGSANTAISFTQAMTLDASGRLLIGSASSFSSAAKLQVQDNISLDTNGTGGRFELFSYGVARGFFDCPVTTGQFNISAVSILTLATAATVRVHMDSLGNVGLGTASFGTSGTKVFAIGSGGEPTTGPADTVQFFSVDRSAGNTIPGIRCEGTGVTDAAITNVTVTNKIAIKVNGTIYYLLATTSAA